MEKRVQDYLYMYLGCEMITTAEDRPFRGTKRIERLTIDNFDLFH